jgi:hypothetical protein
MIRTSNSENRIKLRVRDTEGIGNLQIEVLNGKSSTPVLLKDTLYVTVGRL